MRGAALRVKAGGPGKTLFGTVVDMRIPVSLLVAAAPFMVMACADNGSGSASAGGPPAQAATYAPTEDAGDSGQMTGTLREEEGCIMVEVDEGRLVVPIFPEDRVAADDEALLRFDEEIYEDGDTLELGGGGSGAPVEELDFAEGPEACEGLDSFTVHPSS